jgi:murein L,D-transpeptidase YafK
MIMQRVSLRLVVGFILSLFAFHVSAQSDKSIWILVETHNHILRVMEGDSEREVFDKIAFGRRGVGFEKARNDDKTPLGEYRIGWINDKSKFRRFFGLTYPNLDNAKRAYQSGLIGEHAFRAIMRASIDEDIPPQDTPLGGQIGIHGLGGGSRDVHEEFDWTHGCIAMTNEQIDRLSQWVKKGTLVVIR